MKKAWAIYGVSLAAVCTGTFSLGLRSKAQVQPAQSQRAINQSLTLVAARAPSSSPAPVEIIRVAGFGAVGFAELSDLIQAVSTEQKDRWAKEIAAMPEGPQKRLAAIALYATWIQFDAHAASASLASLGDPFLRTTTIGAVAGAAPTTAMPFLAEMIAKLTTKERRALLPGILIDWSAADPAAVAQFVNRNPKAVTSQEVGSLMSEWAEVDIAAARQWLENDPTFSEDSQVIESLVEKWARTNLAAATEYVRAHAASPAFSSAAAAIAPAVYHATTDGARVFIESLPPEAKGYAVAAILAVNREDLSGLAESIQWAAGFPAGVWTGSLGVAIASWTNRDEEGATRWLSQQPIAERERLLVELFTAGEAELTPRIASLALSISDEGSRNQAVQSLLAPWSDAAALRSAVAALHLGPRETSSLLRAGGLAP